MIESEKVKELTKMTKKEVESAASALYEGGWISDEREEMKEEYNLSDEWVNAICEKLEEYERIDRND